MRVFEHTYHGIADDRGTRRAATDLGSSLLTPRLRQLHAQLARVPGYLVQIERAYEATLAATRSAVTEARRHLVAMAATSEALARDTIADQLGPCESLPELVVRARCRALLLDIA